MTKFTVVQGFSLGQGKDVFEGDTVTVPEDLDEFSAEHFRRQGRLAPLFGNELIGKASLLAAIALAETVDDLNELVSPHETDADIIDAYTIRSAELEEPVV